METHKTQSTLISFPWDPFSTKKFRRFAAVKTRNSLSSQIVVYTVKAKRKTKNLLKAWKLCLYRLMVASSSVAKVFTRILLYRIRESQNEWGWKMQASVISVEMMLPSIWWSEHDHLQSFHCSITFPKHPKA